MRRELLICLALFAVTVGTYWEAHTHEFINYDDPLYVTKNRQVQAGLTADGIAWAFGNLLSDQKTYWHPVTWLSHMLDCQLFGLKAGAHHMVNVVFHAVNAVLLFLLLRVMTGRLVCSAMVAALFALHPIQVDTVAWVAERKNVVSTMLWLLTLLAYVRYARQPDVTRYLTVLVLFTVGLMAKPMLVTLPCVLLLLDYWPLRRIQSLPPLSIDPAKGPAITIPAASWVRILMEKVPLLALSLVSGCITIVAHQRLGLMATMEQLPFEYRLLTSLHAYVGYLNKIIWPDGLAVFYPFVERWPVSQTVVSLALVLGISLLTLKLARRKPWLLIGWFWFLGTLVPVIGILQVSAQAMADRWVYVPLIGLCVAMVWGVADLFSRWRSGRVFLAALAGIVLLTCAVTTRLQLRHWQNSETLFRHALAVTADNYIAHLNLGAELAAQEKLTEAAAHFEEVLRIIPQSPYGHYHRGGVLARQGRFEEALVEYETALRLKPDEGQIHFNYANVLALHKDFAGAKQHFLATLKLHPEHAEAENNLGNVLALEGDLAGAMPHFTRALQLDPNLFEAQYFVAGDLARQKKYDLAVAGYNNALRIKPDYPSALNDLAWILAAEDAPKVRNPEQAIEFARRACELTVGKEPGYLDTLAVAYSEAGRFADALDATQRAVAAARAVDNESLALKIEGRLKHYQQGISYRQSLSAQSTNVP